MVPEVWKKARTGQTTQEIQCSIYDSSHIIFDNRQCFSTLYIDMNKLFQFAFMKMNRVKVYALVGRSGTGKSHHSKIVAAKYKIDYIIDDGLLIKGERILAGHSAKQDPNFISAVRTAVFDDDSHRDEVVDALNREKKLKKILIIGTSEKMIGKITKRLELPPAEKILHIEDVATAEEIETAMRIRFTEGKHVIPVPSIEITRNYPKIVYDSMKILGKRGASQKANSYEKTIVRPEFSKPEKDEISETALLQMVKHAIGDYDPIIKVKRVTGTKNADSTYNLTVILQLPVRHFMSTTISDLQEYLTECIEKYGGILLKHVSIEIEEWG